MSQLNYAWGCKNGKAECYNTHNSNNSDTWDLVGDQGNCNPDIKPECLTAGTKFHKPHSKIKFLNKNNNSMRNFMDFRSLTKDPVTGGIVVAAGIGGGILGAKVLAKKIKIPYLATKYPKVHKIVWIGVGALALAAAAKWGTDKFMPSKAPVTTTPATTTDGSPKSVDLTVQGPIS